MLQRSLRITVDLGEDNPAAAETLQMLGHLCSEEVCTSGLLTHAIYFAEDPVSFLPLGGCRP